MPLQPPPQNRRSLLQYLYPRTLRDRYRERVIRFHLDTVPYYKHNFQSRIYRFILERQRRRLEQSRLLDHARRLLFGQPAAKRIRYAKKMSNYGVGSGNYGADSGRERGARRKKLAAMANNVYKAGAVAVNEIRESYNQTRVGDMDSPENSKITIPGSFPEVAIITKGHEQMVLFPSYAKRHVRESPRQFATPGGPPPSSSMGMNEQEYWRREWARHEDEKAVVDVDVRGWLYNPHRGPMNRRNRILLGLARQLSGIPIPKPQQQLDGTATNTHQQHEEERELQSIAREAREIERRGRAEEANAQKGAYSERPKDEDSEDEGNNRAHDSSGNQSPRLTSSTSGSPSLLARTNTASSVASTEAELALANTNLMARIGPFMTTPLVDVPITLFFYNGNQSQSRTIATDEAGHFITRVALDFVPTHVKVLVNEDISCTEPIQLIEPRGISLISDIDDTIKRSNISMGAKEIFRNTFVRELKDLTVAGVKEWYGQLHNMGVMLHYCSNSPWQLFPVLATYFKIAGLPPGSLHLKKYSGMLQGIFEPVAERKKGTLTKIMNDFPERRFLLVGDSGEADLEVYTELAVAYPGRILAIFIRDVTTPEQAGYFDSAFDSVENRASSKPVPTRRFPKPRDSSNDDPSNRPALPPRSMTTSRAEESITGDLIDLSDEPLPIQRTTTGLEDLGLLSADSTISSGSRKPPPKPIKPAALKCLSMSSSLSNAPPPPPPRRVTPSSEMSTRGMPLHPLSQIHNSSEQSSMSTSQSSRMAGSSSSSSKTNNLPPPPPPPPRRRGTPSSQKSLSPRLFGNRRPTGNSDIDYEPLPVPVVGYGGTSSSGPTSPVGSPGQPPMNKKLELWRRRLLRAQETLGQQGVPLYTWRRGEDVIMEAVGLVKEILDNEKKYGR
ncbi:hypothetical protein F5Y16DRAFT_225449 [Xylariaceae sp. FL0255]|nr:hypothetical protein F5Y16DRAFT_225449 [Xylariaceae sp. FL0255]